jgi:hypothetical protein
MKGLIVNNSLGITYNFHMEVISQFIEREKTGMVSRTKFLSKKKKNGQKFK